MTEIGAALAVPTAVFITVGAGELADKSAVAGALLARRYGAWPVWLAACVAFGLQTALAVAAGRWLAAIPMVPVKTAAGVGLLLTAGWSWRRATAPEDPAAPPRAGRHGFGAAFVTIAALEFGDVTQLATVAWVSRFPRQAWTVGAAAWLALIGAAVVMVQLGSRLGRHLPTATLRRATAVVVGGLGLWLVAATTLGL